MPLPETVTTNPEQRLKDLGLTLPPVAQPVASYVHAFRVGVLIFVSGQIPTKDGRPVSTGKVGKDLTVAQAQEAARVCVLNALAAIKDVAGGLDKVVRIVRTTNYVNVAPGFTDVHVVANGASDLFVQVFGDAGKHTRASVGVSELPLNVPFELEVVAEVR